MIYLCKKNKLSLEAINIYRSLINQKSELKFFKINLSGFFQFIRFSLIGIVATFSHIGTLIFLVEIHNYPPITASTLGFILAVIVSYLLNYHFTFMANGSHFSYFPKYLLVCITGLIINTLIMYLTVEVFKLWYVAGQICTLTIVPIINFILNKFWTFTGREKDNNKI